MTTNRLAKSESPQADTRKPQEICDARNAAMLADPKGRRDVHWYVHDGQVQIGWNRQLGTQIPQPLNVMERDRKGFTPHDWGDLNAYLETKGSPVRYDDYGNRL